MAEGWIDLELRIPPLVGQEEGHEEWQWCEPYVVAEQKHGAHTLHLCLITDEGAGRLEDPDNPKFWTHQLQTQVLTRDRTSIH